MPRNSSGVYTLPASAFVAGTTIKSADVNSDFSDIASTLTLSLATTGVSSMTGPLKSASGTVGAPGLTWASALTTGFYLSAADEMSWTAAGVLAATFLANKNSTWVGSATWTGTVTAATIAAVTTMTLAGRPVTAFDVATAMAFNQTAAPTGWTKQVTHNDKSFRVVSGAVGSGGTVDFSTLFARTGVDNYTLLSADTPSHLHSATWSNVALGSAGTTAVQSIAATGLGNSFNTTSSGSGGAHLHAIDMRVKYVDMILATKD